MSANNSAPDRQVRGANLKPMCAENTPAQHRQQLSDADREQRIDRLRLELIGATEPSVRREIWNRLKAEIISRSSAQVRQMEAEHGLDRRAQ